MYVRKTFSLETFLRLTAPHIIWISAWVSTVTIIYHVTEWRWLSIPWLPMSVIGTAVAFYIGFKNNQAYDRLWEARKIWGSIVNDSRAWGSTVRSFISNHFTNKNKTESELDDIIHRLIYRHIGWLYTLRCQLLVPTPWEHVNQNSMIAREAKRRIKKFGIGLIEDDVTRSELKRFLSKSEYEKIVTYQNSATQIIDLQSQDLKSLREENVIDDFRHMTLQKILNAFYTHQGKCERIKKFPLPRQYANMSSIFVGIFIFLLPFGIVSEFDKIGEWGIWASIPFGILIAWIYLMMELVGDYSENPFEGMSNDIPMLSLCRTIEIDLREMLGETDLPPVIQPVNDVLM
ncbi:MAG: hypothetical protein OCD76_03775 [Reichenbachiella sp.]